MKNAVFSVDSYAEKEGITMKKSVDGFGKAVAIRKMCSGNKEIERVAKSFSTAMSSAWAKLDDLHNMVKRKASRKR